MPSVRLILLLIFYIQYTRLENVIFLSYQSNELQSPNLNSVFRRNAVLRPVFVQIWVKLNFQQHCIYIYYT